jgi:hypothetical protein
VHAGGAACTAAGKTAAHRIERILVGARGPRSALLMIGPAGVPSVGRSLAIAFSGVLPRRERRLAFGH